MYLAPSGGYPPLAMANGRYEPATTHLFQKTLIPGMVVVDIGAHVGYYTLLSAQLVGPTGKIYAFEPEPGNHTTLRKNIELNGYDNIVATQLAVSDRTGNATIYLTSLDSGRHSLFQHDLPRRGSASIETTTLDLFLEARDWPQIDLIKVDVEGAEIAVLDGMAQLLVRSPKLKLIIEFNPALLQSAGVAPTGFLEKVWSLGFQISSVDDADGLLLVTEKDYSSLTDSLLTANTSINLLCTKE
jgi:FkbM family methyltransferase